ncbi:MAG: CIA30 family protein [Gemmatimonadetes bacterium]|nr:CIA30 family protein [Gemmatimonadota bacterium]
MPEPGYLISFDDSDTGEWYVINDGVMGGISQSAIRTTEEGTGVFAGDLSLENNGGFASVRYLFKEPRNLAQATGIEVRVRGDGRTYQLRLRDDDRFDGAAFRASFETKKGEWTVVRIPFEEFVPTFRGRTLTNVPPLDREKIRQVGLMLADKNPGPFSLEIDWIRSRTDSTEI